MDKVDFVRNCTVRLRLPPGFRFHPTDEELVVEYLDRKVSSRPLPASIISDFPLSSPDPWHLPGDLGQERYFFCSSEAKYPNGNKSNRATCSGFWKATGLDKKIKSSKSNQLVGMKKTLVFYTGKPPKGIRTDWIMHEYRLTEKNSTQRNEDWVLCRLFMKKSRKRENDREFVKRRTDFNVDRSSSSSCSSGITEVFSNESSSECDREENSSCNSFAYLRREC